MVVGQLDLDAGVVLHEPDDVALANDRHPELADPVGQNGLEQALPEPEDVVVAGGEVADVQHAPGEELHRMHLPLRHETICDATLIEHLDRAGEETSGTRSVDCLVGATLDDGNVDSRQRQLARQHQTGRATARDHNLMLGHRQPPPDASTIICSPFDMELRRRSDDPLRHVPIFTRVTDDRPATPQGTTRRVAGAVVREFASLSNSRNPIIWPRRSGPDESAAPGPSGGGADASWCPGVALSSIAG